MRWFHIPFFLLFRENYLPLKYHFFLLKNIIMLLPQIVVFFHFKIVLFLTIYHFPTKLLFECVL